MRKKESPSQKADHDTALSVRTPRNFLQKQKTSAPDAEKVPAKPLKAQMNRWEGKTVPAKRIPTVWKKNQRQKADAADTPSAGTRPAGEDSGTGGGSSSNSGGLALRPCCGFAEQRLDRRRKILFFRTRYSKDRQTTQIQIETQAAADKPLLPAAEAEKMTKLWTKKRNRKRKGNQRRRTEKASLAPDHPLDYHSADRLHHSRRSFMWDSWSSPPLKSSDNIYGDLQQTSKIFDDQGELLEYVDASVVRINVTYDQIPKNLINAFVAVEDKRSSNTTDSITFRILGAIAGKHLY